MGRPPGERAVILFDGVCGLCNTGADWIRARDRRGRFEFLPYQSEEARRRFPGLDPARGGRVEPMTGAPCSRPC